MIKKFMSLSGPWAQMMKNVVYIMEPVMGLMGCSLEHHLVRVFHEEAGNNERQ
jgi:hypothetical protein